MTEPNRSRLLWHCRRGMRELDVLLLGWLEAHFDGASPSQRREFAALLDLPDPLLERYLLGSDRPAQPDVARLVDSIRARASIMSSAPAGGNLPHA